MAKPKLPVLSKTEVDNLKAKIAEEESELRAMNHPSDDDQGTHLPVSEVCEVDESAARGRIARYQKALAVMGPDANRLTGAERQKAEARRKKLAEWISERMLTEAEVGMFPDPQNSEKDANYHRAVEKCMKTESTAEFIANAEEWKRIGRMLWPEDPDASNINTIRPAGAKSGRHFA